ncbi:Ribosomal RNA small subunit methyltransferase E [Indibacter alkaliphilus LW1]|jgi:16S rRNA (uracil1498-N3)-methyltransferase|uniref:Ribosomal RNA small subunit methyltransferase E n=1 Tax=Indibacter alkaliphilus (strain CCUG 57479 / KCTC 22604 / LW1) TaxID=1189612 RepID=S2DKX1_INDAL|nr:16S rRNA (uracil(1498)-N(3))-methyltransferase [Indibacter alkaliphilus]EOZ92611.1 Ribosomal RNA small subunit methyltransferase E [Indibacter alkaliphilus LW1]
MQLFFHENIQQSNFQLDPEESRHLIKVLRKQQGDKVNFTDGKGCLFECTIIDSNPKKTTIQIDKRLYTPDDDFYIHLAISPTKNSERMEWMVEKLTEIGVHEISFMESEFSERSKLKYDRLEKKIKAACKQSLKTRVPKLNPVIPMEDLVRDDKFNEYQRFIAYVDKENDRHLFQKLEKDRAYLILIGPEGDFSKQELQLAFDHLFLPCSLGKSRLRSETAALAAVHTIQMKNNLLDI